MNKTTLIPANKLSDVEQQVVSLTNELEGLKEEFVQNEKLILIGRLSAGILHEIKNPLNFINNFTRMSIELAGELSETIIGVQDKMDSQYLADFTDTHTMLLASLNKILENAGRTQRIISSMLAQMHDNKEEVFEPVDINKLVDEFAKLAYQGMRGNDKDFNLKFKTDYDPSIGLITLEFQEMSRVIINLIDNACYALNEKKKTSQSEFSPEIQITTKKINDLIEIRIRDNGTGMPQNIIDKIFNPFYSTKPKGQGTGLGLSLTHNIITNIHKGKIEISSKENEYTEFKILLPLNPA